MAGPGLVPLPLPEGPGASRARRKERSHAAGRGAVKSGAAVPILSFVLVLAPAKYTCDRDTTCGCLIPVYFFGPTAVRSVVLRCHVLSWGTVVLKQWQLVKFLAWNEKKRDPGPLPGSPKGPAGPIKGHFACTKPFKPGRITSYLSAACGRSSTWSSQSLKPSGLGC